MKPKILCSACLGFCACRYDGSQLNSELINILKEYVDFETVCPEMGIGLPSPREAIRIVTHGGERKLVGSYTGEDHTEAMEAYVDVFIRGFDQTEYDGIILKCKSPTCGIKEVKHYPSYGKVQSHMTKTAGFFGGALKSTFKSLIVEDDGRLLNADIRDHFLTSVFLHFEYRKVKASERPYNALLDFHSINKYLLMAYNQAALKRMGQIVANHEKNSIEDVLHTYEEALSVIYASSLKPGKNVNTIQHLFGYFKNDLSEGEKQFFARQMDLYLKGLVSLQAILLILKAWVVRFDDPYLKNQTIFDHYPIEMKI